MPDGFIPSLSALVDSGKRTLKQKLADLLSNPLPYLQQTAGQVNANLYKSDIPDEAVARFLDWDKPLSQQAPEVQKSLSHDPRATDKFYANGGEYYRALMARKSQDAPLHMGANAAEEWAWQMATDQLRSAGVPGIRYLDGGSRSAGQGSSNFVLFDDQLPRILEINGAPTGQQPWKPGEWK